jgi:hypothetical protein
VIATLGPARGRDKASGRPVPVHSVRGRLPSAPMRLSKQLIATLREDPADAEIPSHKLLARGGFIVKIAAGVYTFSPLMWRVVKSTACSVYHVVSIVWSSPVTSASTTSLPSISGSAG